MELRTLRIPYIDPAAATGRFAHAIAEITAAFAPMGEALAAVGRALAGLGRPVERPVHRARRLHIERWMRARDRRALRRRRTQERYR